MPVRPIRRGHVYRHSLSGVRVVVLSDDDYNEMPYTGMVLAAPITRHDSDAYGNEIPYLVNLAEDDAVGGYVKIAEVGPVAVDSLVAPDKDEILSGASLSNIKFVLDEFVGY